MEHLSSKQIDLFQIRELIFKPLWFSLFRRKISFEYVQSRSIRKIRNTIGKYVKSIGYTPKETFSKICSIW